MAAPFDLNDDSVVVIIGTGAGRRRPGQRTGPEGRQRRRAGGGRALPARGLRQRRMGKLRPAGLDRPAHDLRRLARGEGLLRPAGLDRQGRRRHHDPLGRRVAALPGPRVEGRDHLRRRAGREPARLADRRRRDGALVRQGREQARRHPHRRPRRTARQQQLQGVRKGRQDARLQGSPHRPHGDQLRRLRRPPGLPADRLLLPGLQVGRQMVGRLYRHSQAAKPPATSRCASSAHVAARSCTTTRQGDRRRLFRRGRQPADAEGAHRLRRRQLVRKPAPAAELRLSHVPRRAGQLLRPGRAQLHAPHDRLGLCASSTSRCRCGAARRWPGSSRTRRATIRRAASSAATSWRRSALGLPFMAAFLDPGGWGREFTTALDGYENMAGMWIVGEDMPQETNRVTLNHDVKDQYGLPVANVHFDDHPNDIAMRNHAYKQGRRSTRRSARRAPSRRRPIRRRTTSAPTGCRRTRATASSTSGARPTTSRTCSSRTARSSPPARRRTRR